MASVSYQNLPSSANQPFKNRFLQFVRNRIRWILFAVICIAICLQFALIFFYRANCWPSTTERMDKNAAENFSPSNFYDNLLSNGSETVHVSSLNDVIMDHTTMKSISTKLELSTESVLQLSPNSTSEPFVESSPISTDSDVELTTAHSSKSLTDISPNSTDSFVVSTNSTESVLTFSSNYTTSDFLETTQHVESINNTTVVPRNSSTTTMVPFEKLLENKLSVDANKELLRRQINVRSLNELLNSQQKYQPQNVSARTLCPKVPPNLLGRLNLTNVLQAQQNASEELVAADNSFLKAGGSNWPKDCRARHQVAFILPYRDRHEQLVTFLAHMHPLLRKQQLHYRIFVVEQSGNQTFNKGILMNVAFAEALKMEHFDCFVFHDVDLLAEDDRNMYSCPTQPRHMSVAVDTLNYTLPYWDLVGGVLALRIEHFMDVNGYSNLYWGWGAEDDDMALRIIAKKLEIIRPPAKIARYTMLKHNKRSASTNRYKLYNSSTKRLEQDGVSTISSLNYTIVSIENKALYTHITVDVGNPPAELI